MANCPNFTASSQSCSIREDTVVPNSWIKYCQGKFHRCKWYHEGKRKIPVTLEDSDSPKKLDLDVFDNILTSMVSTATSLGLILTELGDKMEDLEFTGAYQLTGVGANDVNQLGNHVCLVVLLQSEIDNTGNIYWGFASGSCFYCLEAGEAASIPCSNSNKIWTKIVVDTEKITYGTWA